MTLAVATRARHSFVPRPSQETLQQLADKVRGSEADGNQAGRAADGAAPQCHMCATTCHSVARAAVVNRHAAQLQLLRHRYQGAEQAHTLQTAQKQTRCSSWVANRSSHAAMLPRAALPHRSMLRSCQTLTQSWAMAFVCHLKNTCWCNPTGASTSTRADSAVQPGVWHTQQTRRPGSSGGARYSSCLALAAARAQAAVQGKVQLL